MADDSILLGKYDDGTRDRYAGVLAQVFSNYPRVLSRALRNYEERILEEEYSAALKPATDLYELTIQFLTSVVLSLIRHGGDVPPTLRGALERLSGKVLSPGDWHEIFRQVMASGDEAGVELATSFARWYRTPGGKVSAMGKVFDLLPNFRNNLAHDTTQSAGDARQRLADIESCLVEFLESVEPISRFALVVVRRVLAGDAGVNRYVIEYQRGMGGPPLKISTRATLATDGCFLVPHADFNANDVPAETIVPLLPLVVFTPPPCPDGAEPEDGSDRLAYVFLSKTQHERRLSYVTAERHPKKETERYTELFYEMMRLFLGRDTAGPWQGRSIPRPLDWKTIVQRSRTETESFIGNMSAKYDPGLFVPRSELELTFERFLSQSERNALVLLGESGSGKTCAICDRASRIAADGNVAVAYYCKVFAGVDLAEQLAGTFGSRQPFDELLETLSQLAVKEDRWVVFLFDAVNECFSAGGGVAQVNPARLVQRIDQLIVARRHPRIKVVMSCRNYTWEDCKRAHGHGVNPANYFTQMDLRSGGGPDGGEVCLKGFSEKEFDVAYPKYAARYGVSTSLDGVKERRSLWFQLRDPLRLKLTCECYRGSALPSSVVSVKLLERQYEEAARQEGTAEQSDSDSLMLLFARLLWRRGADAIPVFELHDAMSLGPSERGVYTSDEEQADMVRVARRLYRSGDGGVEHTPLFDRLLGSGHLRIERGTSFHEIRFVYERFHEYLLARLILDRFMRKTAGRTDALVRSFEGLLAGEIEYAVMWGAIRNALLLHFFKERRPEVLLALARSDSYGASGMVVEVLNCLVPEDYPASFALLAEMLRPRAEEGLLTDRKDELEEQRRRLTRRLRQRDCSHREEKLEKLGQTDAELAQILPRLAPALQSRRTAIKVLYDVYRSRWFAESIYREDGTPGRSPLDLLWQVLADPLDSVRDAATLHIYYLWLEHPDVAMNILRHLAEECLDAGFIERLRSRFRHSRLEPCARISALILCEELASRRETGILEELQRVWTGILGKMTLGGWMTPLIKPAVAHLVSNAGNAISEYVNNLTEYQHFFDTVPRSGAGFTMETFSSLVPFLDPDHPGFEQRREDVVAGAALGDGLCNFLLERVLIAQGVRGYERIADIVDAIYHNPANCLPDYTQMSMLYVIFHTLDKMESVPEGPFLRFQEYLVPWTDRTFGRFVAHRNDEANRGLPYKQYTLNWYGALHSKLLGDGCGELALFKRYLKDGFDRGDRRMFCHAVDNIAMLAADFGFWRSALSLFSYALGLFRTEADLDRFRGDGSEAPVTSSSAGRSFDVRTYLARSLATVRGYFGREVDRFVMDELAEMDFPGFGSFRDELTRYEAGENIGDLLTHKFGNLFVLGIVRIPAVRREIAALLSAVPESRSSAELANLIAARELRVLIPGL